ncbi:hypothetical protein VP1G_02000 [Cytospora mali]|uniref:Uncharacterized protein n=1 Tax=Cytospora mali TaxID=578113 RepID=A0A194USD1_CYTMA|nr:hypothetical protein VP1G_02000 [Valsa mali var. pyri (nom. inval.)]
MGIFGSGDGEGGTMAERIALIGILCFAFVWIPVFIVWKLISVCRERNRSPEKEVEAGNMPVTTNPTKPNRNSIHSSIPPRQSHPVPVQESVPASAAMGMDDLPQAPGLREQGATAAEDVQGEHRGKRKPMPTHPVEPKMRMLPDPGAFDDATELMNQDNSTGRYKSKKKSDTASEVARPGPNFWWNPESDHSSGDPGPSFRRQRKHE